MIVMVTGHPATGKTTLAHHLARELKLPLLWRDQIKETLLDRLDRQPAEDPVTWSRRLSALSWTLLYQRVDSLLQARVPHVVESNFDPTYADSHWRILADTYPLRLTQVRCQCAPETLLARYRNRIDSGERHPGHVDDSENDTFLAAIRQGPLPWVAISGQRLAVDTTYLTQAAYPEVAQTLAAELMQ